MTCYHVAIRIRSFYDLCMICQSILLKKQVLVNDQLSHTYSGIDKTRCLKSSIFVGKLIALFSPLDEVVASRAVFIIVSGQTGRRAETLLEPAE